MDSLYVVRLSTRGWVHQSTRRGAYGYARVPVWVHQSTRVGSPEYPAEGGFQTTDFTDGANHRAGRDGPKVFNPTACAWFVWDRSHRGPATINRISSP
jgi:hypothetical protein